MIKIALNLIAGAGNIHTLRRCIEPIRHFFDGLVIGVTTDDPEILGIVEDLYPSCIVKINWITEKHPFGHFGEARELLKQKTEADYILWLNADDVLPVDGIMDKLQEIKLALEKDNIDFATMEYRLDYDDTGNYGKIIRRARIFKNTKEICWDSPVYERLVFNPDPVRLMRTIILDNIWIEHRPRENGNISRSGNLKIFESIEDTPEYDWRMRYFHGMELLSASKFGKAPDGYALDSIKQRDHALELLADCITEQEGTKENNAYICICLAYEYLYGRQGHCVEIPREYCDLNKAETYIRLSLTLSDDFAESFVILGDILNIKGAKEQAVKLYKMALNKKPGMLELRTIAMYREIPIRRLARELAGIDTEQALWYAKKAIIYEAEYRFVYKQLLDNLFNESKMIMKESK